MEKIMGCLLVIGILFGCNKGSDPLQGGGDNPDWAFSSENLEGKIGGQPWTFVSGRARPSPFKEGELFLDFWNSRVENPCDKFIIASAYSAMNSVPAKVGETVFSLGTTGNLGSNMTLYDGKINYIAERGAMQILSIDIPNAQVSGRVHAIYNEDNEINGIFELTYCP